jgi:NAD(P)H dehydrogenase (quinone)
MNILIITAHPSSKGFSHRIANSYADKAIELGYSIETVDLYKSPRQDFLTFEDKHDDRADQIKIRSEYQAKITWADELVFVHPMWWGSMPAIMKNWIDVNFSGGFSHSYKDGKPFGLLQGKQAKVFITSDAPAFLYWFLAKPYAITWSIIILRFVGIKTKCVKLYGNKRKRTEEENTIFLQKVQKLVSKSEM